MKLIRSIFRKLLSFTVLPLLKFYLSRTVRYRYHDLQLTIVPGVFHPGFFFSSRFLGKYLSQQSLKGKQFLDLGTGSGLLAFIACKGGAEVTASDISMRALENLKQNQKENGVFFPLIHSDLFEKFSKIKFDVIAVNPPYYKRNPLTEADHAWYCGENGEYFKRLFEQLPAFLKTDARLIMVLSEDCALDEIKAIAAAKGFKTELLQSRRIWLEMNYIFSFKRNQNEAIE